MDLKNIFRLGGIVLSLSPLVAVRRHYARAGYRIQYVQNTTGLGNMGTSAHGKVAPGLRPEFSF
eukprot:SAG31_NODE_134_length_23213_cov_5.698624_18_plen_64_part_00